MVSEEQKAYITKYWHDTQNKLKTQTFEFKQNSYKYFDFGKAINDILDEAGLGDASADTKLKYIKENYILDKLWDKMNDKNYCR